MRWSGLAVVGLLAPCLVACNTPVRNAPARVPAQLADRPHESGLRQHTFSAIGEDLDPEVAPDGKRLFFASSHDSPNHQIFSKLIDGKVLTQITWGRADHRQPRLSPDGRWLLYASNPHGNWDLFLLDLSRPKSRPTPLASTPDDEFGASWSPDGGTVVYCRYSRYAGDWQLWRRQLSSGAAQRIGERITGLFPRYAPGRNDDWILFQRYRSRSPYWATLWLIRPDATRPTQLLAHSRWGAIGPDWDGSGQWVVFASVAKTAVTRQVLRERADDIWRLRRDGTGLTRLTSHPSSDWSPSVASVGGEERVFFVSDRRGRPNIFSVRLR